MKTYLNTLRTEAWRTSGARYNAARRLERRGAFSTISLALFSAMSVAIAFLQHLYAQPESPANSYLTAMSVCLGIFILTISLTEWGAANDTKAKALHRNAEELNEFQRKLAFHLARIEDQNEQLTWEKINELTKEYEAIKAQCFYNHQPLDERYFRVSKTDSPELQGKGAKPLMRRCSWVIKFCWHVSCIWYFSIFWSLILLSFVGVFFIHGWGFKPC